MHIYFYFRSQYSLDHISKMLLFAKIQLLLHWRRVFHPFLCVNNFFLVNTENSHLEVKSTLIDYFHIGMTNTTTAFNYLLDTSVLFEERNIIRPLWSISGITQNRYRNDFQLPFPLWLSDCYSTQKSKLRRVPFQTSYCHCLGFVMKIDGLRKM